MLCFQQYVMIDAAQGTFANKGQYINLRRGSYVIAFIGAWALTPWNILSSASALLNFMDGYIIWVGKKMHTSSFAKLDC
jgi:NCS1 family nucleobase:cation symporter-1